MPTAEETEAHSRQQQEAALRQLEPWPRRSLEGTRGTKAFFPKSGDRALLSLSRVE